MIKAVLFDLDGTLLPMDQDKFMKAYFTLLSTKLIPYGYDPKSLIEAVWHGTMAMVKNDGSNTNEEVFWEDFTNSLGSKVLDHKYLFEEFYNNDFSNLKDVCGFTPESSNIINLIKKANRRIIIATNPVFPRIATKQRIEWCNINTKDLELYTTYETTRYCKPNLNYYRDILEQTNLNPYECIMIGNDTEEDMIVEQLGMEVFLLTDCLINKKSVDINKYLHGSFNDLKVYLANKL